MYEEHKHTATLFLQTHYLLFHYVNLGDYCKELVGNYATEGIKWGGKNESFNK